MKTTAKTTKLEKMLYSNPRLVRKYGDRMADEILGRLAMLQDAPNLEAVSTQGPARRHQLKGDRQGQFAVDLVHPYRLVFEPDHEPIPRKSDGGIDLTQVTKITIIEIVDYH